MKIANIKNTRQLANFLRCEESFLQNYLNGNTLIVDSRQHAPFTTYDTNATWIQKLYIRKRVKHPVSYREVYAVRTETLNNILKGVSTYLKENYRPSASVHGYVQGRNIRTNAESHLAKKIILSVDIKNFFESITSEMVHKALLKVGFSELAAQQLSIVITVNNFLPPGYSTSPIISNIVFNEIDEELIALSGEDCVYTRYADDLYFSTNIKLPELEKISAIIVKGGFTLNPHKTKFMCRGAKQYVTGMTVFDNVRPRIPKNIKRNLRLELHYITKYGIKRHTLNVMGYSLKQYEDELSVSQKVDAEIKNKYNRISGWMKYLNSVEKPAAQKLISMYQLT